MDNSRLYTYSVAILISASCFLLLATSSTPLAAQTTRRNVIIFVCDGLRAGSVNSVDSPTIYALENSGVTFANSHSLFPTFTTPNAAAIATGHYLGDTGDYSNYLYTAYPVFNMGNYGNAPGTVTPKLEDDQILGDIDDHFGGNYLTEETFLAYARAGGYDTAAVGKSAPVLIQDVTEGNIDHSTGKVPVPITVIIDDSTGNKGGLPLPDQIVTGLIASGIGIVAPTRGPNNLPGNNATPGTLSANVKQQQYFADAVTKVILPSFSADKKPFALVFWSRDPDGTQHYQGDSLNRLTPGINGPTSKAAITNADSNLKQILNYLNTNGLVANTDIFVIADHGFSTISHRELDAYGTATTNYAATITYKDAKGRQEVNAGYTPVGFLAIDLAHFLKLPLFDPDSQIKIGGVSSYEPVDPTIGQQTDTKRQYPIFGDGLIGGAGTITTPTDAQVIVAANGGSDLVYVPTGTLVQRIGLVKKIVDFLTKEDYTSGLFTDDAFGPIPGALPLSAISLEGSASLPEPAIVVNFRSFTLNLADPYQNGVTFVDSSLQEGQGQHGSFSRADTDNFMAVAGPDFKRGFVDRAPISNADVEVTIADILNFQTKNIGKLTGRVINESLLNEPDNAGKVISGTLKSKPAASGQQTILKYQQLGATRYFDAAGFPDETVGL
jgi:hypothetical protein